MKKAMHLATLAMGMAAAIAPTPSSAKAPEGLHWETLDLMAFAFDAPGYEATPAAKDLARSIWGKTMDSFPPFAPNRKWPVFVIQKVVETPAKRYLFSSMNAAASAYPSCEDPPNSSAPDTPIYAKCPMRVIVLDKATGKSAEEQFKGYCNITTNDREQPKTRNYAQVAVDTRTNTAYYRVVQYGKPAPECDRTIRLPR